MFQSAVFHAEHLPLAELLLKAFSQNVSAVSKSEAKGELCAVSPALEDASGFSFLLRLILCFEREVL